MSAKEQRGIASPAELIGILLGLAVVIGACTGLYMLWAKHQAALDLHGYQRGMQEQKALDQAQRLKDMAAWDAERATLQRNALQTQQQVDAQVAVLTQQLTEERENANRKNDDFMAGLRGGRYVLRDPAAAGSGSGGAAGIGGAGSAAGTGPGDHGAGGREFSQQASGFLYAEASRADDIVRRLVKAQQVIRLYRANCTPDGSLPGPLTDDPKVHLP